MESTIMNMFIAGHAVKEEKSKVFAEREEEGTTEETFKEEEIESTKSQMILVKQENTRLKILLEQIENDFKYLKMRFTNINVQQESKSTHNTTISTINEDDIEEPDELVSLSLGRSPCVPKKEGTLGKTREEDECLKDGLKLGLDYNYEGSKMEVKDDLSPHSSLKETKETEPGEIWPPIKVLKTVRRGDDEVSHPPPKRARVCVRARCDAPTLNDGCQWRKYGQKIAKGNPCPRAYYRCTVAPSCPVRKQVQRYADDMSILITTYEGTHNHPLPILATAMASTTSAAASMLLSGSSSSQPGFGSSTTTSSISLSGINMNVSELSKTRSFYLPNSSTHQSPTITLDLATNIPSTSSPHFNTFSSTIINPAPRFLATSMDFSSPETSMLPSLWSNSGQTLNRTHINGSFQIPKPPQEHCYQQQALAETLSKAITTDYNIQSVIAAAISSLVAGGKKQGIDSRGENLMIRQNLKWAEQFQVINSTPLTPNGNACGSSFMNQSTTSLNSQTGNSRPPQQIPLAFSISNSASRSTVDDRDQTN